MYFSSTAQLCSTLDQVDKVELYQLRHTWTFAFSENEAKSWRLFCSCGCAPEIEDWSRILRSNASFPPVIGATVSFHPVWNLAPLISSGWSFFWLSTSLVSPSSSRATCSWSCSSSISYHMPISACKSLSYLYRAHVCPSNDVASMMLIALSSAPGTVYQTAFTQAWKSTTHVASLKHHTSITANMETFHAPSKTSKGWIKRRPGWPCPGKRKLVCAHLYFAIVGRLSRKDGDRSFYIDMKQWKQSKTRQT